MISYRITSLGIGVLIATVIILLVRKDLLHTRYSIMWLSFAMAAAFFGMFPQLNDRVALYLGVAYPPILFVIGAMGIIIIKLLTMDIDRSKQERDIRMLNEKIAILEGERFSSARTDGPGTLPDNPEVDLVECRSSMIVIKAGEKTGSVNMVIEDAITHEQACMEITIFGRLELHRNEK
ncbi:MAG: DUF2304 domain-containing protein [Desulfamplus sp.]|nr:DUF2304 domain-containing protein [Desulfamplus sp.]